MALGGCQEPPVDTLQPKPCSQVPTQLVSSLPAGLSLSVSFSATPSIMPILDRSPAAHLSSFYEMVFLSIRRELMLVWSIAVSPSPGIMTSTRLVLNKPFPFLSKRINLVWITNRLSVLLNRLSHYYTPQLFISHSFGKGEHLLCIRYSDSTIVSEE